jgi:hypothetical protein
MTAPEAPRRLRAGDVIADLQALLELALSRSPGEPYVTVEHTLNAKGDTQTSTKVSAPLGHDITALTRHAKDVEALAFLVYEKATGRYPRTNGETK